LIVFAATFMPWYRAAADQLPRTAWQESPVVLALLLAVAIAGAALAAASARKRSLRRRAGATVFGLTLVTTIAVVVSLFIDRPGGNAATAVAFGGYPALLGINLVKMSAILMLVRRNRREH
jgi:ferric-dicitrate binding protein FerR (iron transport regulator)